MTPRRTLTIALLCGLLSLLLLAVLLSGCAGQMCFQPPQCYSLMTYHWTKCPPPGSDWCAYGRRP